ncbi:MAG: class I SAM-dependent methyltransferase [Verrucomicrobia bacterium]|nr:class I SAM-dependent methyltransferase [Verrucomicrobiota bacterium]
MAAPHSDSPPLIVFEDEDLLVAAKPPGWSTHAPSPHAVPGLFEWLRDREPRWSSLEIVQRLDKETSGLLVFLKSARAKASLTRRFAERQTRKKYLLLSHKRPARRALTIRRPVEPQRARRAGAPREGKEALTRFELIGRAAQGWLIAARPETGRTHQVRIHAAAAGFPVLGDALYGGRPAPRLCLHAAELEFPHPADGRPLRFRLDPDFEEEPAAALRKALFSDEETNGFRVIHGAADGQPGWRVDRLAGVLLAEGETPPAPAERAWLETLAAAWSCRSVFFRPRVKSRRETDPETAALQQVAGDPAPSELTVLENGVRYLLRLDRGCSVGLFLDQRDNRRRVLVGYVGRDFGRLPEPAAGGALNLFAYTCAFSVCAAKAGRPTVSVDLSRRSLDWGRENFQANGLDPDAHRFLRGDAWDWMRRLRRKGERFALVIVDPPTFSSSKTSGVFRAEKDYDRLVAEAAALTQPGGVLFASCNALGLSAARFKEAARRGLAAAGRKPLAESFFTQPPDFPSSPEEPAYLKTLWLRLH